MISLLIGTLEYQKNNDITLLVNGIWYTVTVPGKTLGLKSIGDTLKLWIYHHQTEMGDRLIGFDQQEDREIFSKLLSVNGLWPKGALSLLELWKNEIMQAIASWDSKRLTRASGIWPKLANKIIVELRGNIDTEMIQHMTADQKRMTRTAPIYSEIDQSIITSLTGMGYDKKVVENLIPSIPEHLVWIGDRTIWCIRNLHHR